MSKTSIIPQLSSHLFWDLDRNTLNEKDSKEIIIQRVIEYGLMEDWRLIKNYYGLEIIKKVAVQIKNLDNVSLAFLCNLFNLEEKEFRCYKHRQSNPHFWSY